MRIVAFAGMIPRLQPHLLPDSNAQEALNVKLTRSSLAPFKTPLSRAVLTKAGEIKTIYRFLQNYGSDQNYWFHFLNDTDVVRGFVVADTLERTFYTEAGSYPKVTDASLATGGPDYPTAFRQLGVPRPINAALLTTSGSATGDPSDVVVAFAFVNGFGEEGALSPVSNEIALYPGQTLTAQNIEGNPGGYWNVTGVRLYVAQTDAQGYSAYRYWAQISIGTTSYGAQVNFSELGEQNQTPSPLPPPTSLFGLDKHPNGFMVGLADNKFCRSEIFKPYAWPSQYQEPLIGDPVACCVIGQATVIGTNAGSYFAYGSDPLNQSVEAMKQGQPCSSKRSMKLTPIGVVYSCPDGLVSVDAGGQSTIVTDGLFSREQWQALNPSSMHAVVHDSRYIFWYDTGTKKAGFILDFKDGQGLVEIDTYATAAYSDPTTDSLYIVKPSDQNLYKWDGGTSFIPMLWRTRDITLVSPLWIGAVKLVGDFSAGPATVKIYLDGIHWRTRTIGDEDPFRIRPKRARRISVEVSGLATLTELHFAPTLHDLAAGQ